MPVQRIGDKVHSKREDWSILGSGMPASTRIKDPEIRRIVDRVKSQNEYLMKKIRDIHKHDPMPPLTNVAKSNVAVLTLAPPTCTVSAATVIGWAGTTATLNGVVIGHGFTATYHFEYGLTTDYGSTTTPTATENGTSSTVATAALSGLTAGTTYHFRLVATNASGTGYSDDLTFVSGTKAVNCRITETGEVVSVPFFAVLFTIGDWSYSNGGATGDQVAALSFGDRIAPNWFLELALATPWAGATSTFLPLFATDGYPHGTVTLTSGSTYNVEVGYDYASHA